MDRLVPISEARATLGDLVDEAAEHEVYLLRHGRPVAVMISIAAHEAILERLEDLEDRLSVHEAHDFVPWAEARETAATA
ncbi:MAG: type II toxin-antitoxin system Phd/YefM family antitoxin [Aeromicrobium sp.]|uniref:type II toxin-antitoxin system Phd/YefM family antitoxin n=1 Tax=Aeromicrobium sp. TaxID=1871063 RepID=UPI0039E601B3